MKKESFIDYVEKSWVHDLRNMLRIPDEKWFGIVVAFIEDRMNDSYRQGLADGKGEVK